MTAPVAIVGIGCRVPGASSPRQLWRLLRDGVDAIRVVPPDRWDADALYDPDPSTPGKMNTRWGGFLDEVDGFDADFFRISQREAARMDPQQRIALEVAWEALEDAGIAARGLSGSNTGVYMGVSTYDHGSALTGTASDAEPYDGTGSALSIVANRLSYCLDLRGPSVVVDTACSSSLVSVHMACQALAAGETELAIAGGVNVITSPAVALTFSKGGLMAPDGRCKTFDHRADGYVRSEGAGVVMLKPLAAALADGDRIYAVVEGSAVNQDGRTNGLTAPNRPAQEAVLRAAYAAAGVDPAEIDYAEAHGTGTAVGDPIEVAALASVLGAPRAPGRPLRIGSVKSNLGHLEAAAGVTGLIKAALALHHGELPPSIHFQEPNPMLGLERIPVSVQCELEPWPEGERGARAGVSSFGFGGTNAHVVLAAAPARAERPVGDPPRSVHLVPVSARSEAALASRAAAWAEAARDRGDDPEWTPRAAAAAALRTDHHDQRAAIVASDPEELAAGMGALARGERATGVCGPRTAQRRPPRPVLVFPGQGAQWPGMGRALARAVPTFREAIRRCDTAIARRLGASLWDDDAGLIAEGTAHVQPALFAIQVALAETWRSWGVEPAAVVGHSMGEIAAAHVAGALSLDDAARLACERSGLLAEITGEGGLALVELDLDEAGALIQDREDELSIAAANGPRATVLSGVPRALDDVLAELSRRGVFARRIAVEFAAHSPQVEPLQPRLRAALDGLAPRDADVPLYSTVTGQVIGGAELGPRYWERNLRETVLFAPALERLLADGHNAFVEIAPHPVLARSVAEVVEDAGSDAVVASSMRRDEDELRGMLGGLGQLFTFGVRVDWAALHPDGAAYAELPPHGWEHRRFPVPKAPVGRPASAAPPPAQRSEGDLLGRRIRVGAAPALRLWSLDLDLSSRPELGDHVVDGVPLVPAAYWLSAAAEAAAESVATGAVVLEGVTFSHPRPLSDAPEGELQIGIRPTREGELRFTIASCPEEGNPVAHAQGAVRAAVGRDAPARRDPHELGRSCPEAVALDELYAGLERAGLRYGDRFRGIARLQAGAHEALAEIRLPEALEAAPAPAHPALLDACFHCMAAATGRIAPEGGLPLPVGVERVWSRHDAEPLAAGWCHARLLDVRDRDVIADVTVLDPAGVPVWWASGLRVRLTALRRPPEEGCLYGVQWERTEPVAVSTEPRGWLVLADAAEAGRALARRLGDAGDRCIVVVGGWPAAGNERSFDVTAAAPYEPLFAELEADGAAVHGVIDARAASGDGDALGEGEPEAVAAQALWLVQAVAERTWTGAPPRLWLLTAATQAGAPANASTLAGSTLWGLGRVLDNEAPEIGCSLVDLDWPVDERDLDALVPALRAADPPGQIAVRDGGLLGPVLAPVAGQPANAALRVRSDRTYLITGGLGVLGLLVARRLVARGARRLLLIGRRGPSSEAVAALDQLREAGAEVRVARADVADPDQLAAALGDIGDTPYPVGGVIHAAGVLEDALVTALDEEKLRRALAGKARGAWNLHRATRDMPIELFVLFSSLAGLVGSPGQAAYAAANSFLDSLARHRAALGLPALSIGWGPWAGAGLAVDARGVDRLAARGVPPLEPDAALDLLDQAVGAGPPQLAAAALDWDRLKHAGAGPAARQLLSGLTSEQQDGGGQAGAARDSIMELESPAERRRAMRDFLVEQVADVLRIKTGDVDGKTPFQDLGFDSLMAIELRDRLEGALGTTLSATLLFRHPTVDSLADGLTVRFEGERAPATAAADDDVSELDDDELAELVAEELEALAGGDER